MPDSDRLQQLRRQRALAAEQLAWLDQEIAALEGRPAAPPPATALASEPKVAPVIAPTLKRTAASILTPPPASSYAEAAPAHPAIDAMLDEYRVPEDAMKSDVKKGCFLYFFGALALVAVVVAVLYFALRHN